MVEEPRAFTIIDRTTDQLASWAATAPRAWTVMVIVVAVGVALASRFPAYVGSNERSPGSFVLFAGTPYGQAITWWLEHPFQPVPAPLFFPDAARRGGAEAGRAAHLDKLSVRIVLPLLNQLTHAGVGTILLANHLAMLGLFWMVYAVCRDTSGDPVQGGLAACAYAACWAGEWGFEDFIFGDAVAIALVLLGSRLRPVHAFACFVVAGFTDERALFTLPLASMLRWWLAPIQYPVPWRGVLAPGAVAILFYGLVRIFMAVGWEIRSGLSMVAHSEILLYHFFVSFPSKVFRIWEFLWIYPVTLVGLWGTSETRSDRLAAAIYALCLLAATMPAVLVWDLDRSVAYLLPGMVLAVGLLPLEQRTRRRLLFGVMLASVGWVEFFGTALRYFTY